MDIGRIYLGRPRPEATPIYFRSPETQKKQVEDALIAQSKGTNKANVSFLQLRENLYESEEDIDEEVIVGEEP